MKRVKVVLAIAACGLLLASARAQAPVDQAPRGGAAPTEQSATGITWTTLGTNSGPIPSTQRHEPSNLLSVGSEKIMIDAGDGSTEQLARAGMPLADLHVLILTHLHFDHTGGLFAVITERYQMVAPGTLTIYGPPGTKAMVASLIAAMKPAPPFGFKPPAKDVNVIEVNSGNSFTVGSVKVTAVRNTHYSVIDVARGFVSLSYRFDMQNHAIAFTGDTGPSAAVDKLAQGVDLLVSEIINPDYTLATIRKSRPDLSKIELFAIKEHFEHEHLTPDQVGLMAQKAGVKRLVLTHNSMPPDQSQVMQPGIAAHYKGPITFARDLERFPVSQ